MKENRRVALTKDLLKENLLRLMSEKDVQKITISELCAATGINRGTFYKHYKCIDDVLLEIEKSAAEKMMPILANGKAAPLSKRIETSCIYLQKHHDLAKLLFLARNSNSEFEDVMLNTYLYNIFEQELSDIEDEESKKIVISFIFHGIFHMIRKWILDDCPITPKEMGELVCQIASKGWKNTFAPQR